MAIYKRVAGNLVIQTLNSTDSVTFEGEFANAAEVIINGDLTVTGNASLTGNIAGDRIFSGTSNIEIPTPSGNITVSVGGTSNVLVVGSGGANITGFANVTGNLTAGNLSTGGSFSVTGNIDAANLNTTGNVVLSRDSGVGNATIQFTDTDTIVAAGQQLGSIDFFTNDASFAARVTAALRTVYTGTLGNATISLMTSDNGGALTSRLDVLSTGNVGIANTAPVNQLAVGGSIWANGAVTLTGNVSAANISTAGLITATGNVTVGNLITAGLITATGNISGGNLVLSGGGSAGAGGFSATGNVTGGNVASDGIITASGNINTNSDFNGTNVSASGNITGGNVSVSTGNIVGGNLNISGNIVDTGAINILTSSNGNIGLIPNGTGQTNVTGLLSVSGNVVTGNLNISGNIVDTGPINILTSSNGNIGLSPNGTGQTNVTGLLSASGNVVGNIVQATAALLAPTYANATVRDAAITSPVAGMLVFNTDIDGLGAVSFQGYDGTSWGNITLT